MLLRGLRGAGISTFRGDYSLSGPDITAAHQGSFLRSGSSGAELFSFKALYGYRYRAVGYRRCASGGDVSGGCKIGTGTGVGLKFPPSSSETLK